MANLLLGEYVEKFRKVNGENTDIWLCDQVLNGFLEDAHKSECVDGKLVIYVASYRFTITFGMLSKTNGKMICNKLVSLHDNDTNEEIYASNTYRTPKTTRCEIF